MNPKDLKYTSEHEWIKVEGNTATVGVTDFAQERLTDVVFVELPKVGKTVKKGEVLAVLESVKAVSDVYSPVSGEVVEINETLLDKPELVNKESYGKGWVAKLKIKNSKELEGFMSADEYEEFLKKEK